MSKEQAEKLNKVYKYFMTPISYTFSGYAKYKEEHTVEKYEEMKKMFDELYEGYQKDKSEYTIDDAYYLEELRFNIYEVE